MKKMRLSNYTNYQYRNLISEDIIIALKYFIEEIKIAQLIFNSDNIKVLSFMYSSN